MVITMKLCRCLVKLALITLLFAQRLLLVFLGNKVQELLLSHHVIIPTIWKGTIWDGLVFRLPPCLISKGLSATQRLNHCIHCTLILLLMDSSHTLMQTTRQQLVNHPGFIHSDSYMNRDTILHLCWPPI